MSTFFEGDIVVRLSGGPEAVVLKATPNFIRIQYFDDFIDVWHVNSAVLVERGNSLPI